MVKKTKAEMARILNALYKAPYILEKLLKDCKTCNDYTRRYIFGTITTTDMEMIKEFFYEKENNKNK